MQDTFIIDGIRTAIGSFRGTLSAVRTDDLAAHVIRALLDRHPKLDPVLIDDVILGCANQAGEDNRNVARMALLLAGLVGKMYTLPEGGHYWKMIWLLPAGFALVVLLFFALTFKSEKVATS